MSPARLPYHVCSSTSEDSDHPAKELDVQGPHSRGWRSRQFCIYPQEVAFQLGTRTHISRIQVLLHQLLIPERIDFFVGDVERGKDETYANARFAKLGYVSLSPADDVTGGRARELKSVAVDCEGRFIKLLIHRNHMSKVNKYNQVSILGVNFLGEEKEANNNTVPVPPVRSGSAPLTQDGVNNYDDLAFNMYTDHETVKHMRKLEARKAAAAKLERFDYAQNCKQAVELLHRAGLRLGKYEIEKRLAIEEENYDRAKQKKDHIDEYRTSVMHALRVQQLLEEDGTNSNNDILMELELPPPPGKMVRPPSAPAPATAGSRPQSDPLPPIPRSPERPPTEPRKPLTPPPPLFPVTRSGSPPPPPPSYEPAPAAASPVPARRAATPPPAAADTPPAPAAAAARDQPPNKYALYEERTLPAIRGKRLAASAGVEYAERHSERSANLTDEDRKLASLPIEVFGEPLVGNFYAKAFAQKEEGLRSLLAALRADSGSVKPDKMTRAATMLLQRALKDKVYTVCQLTTETLDYLTGPYAAKHKTSRRELSTAMDSLLPDLIQKTGDNATRVQALAVDSLTRLAEVAHARQIPAVGAALTTPLQGAVPARVAQARLEVVEQMITKHGVSSEADSPMSLKSVSQLGASAVDSPHEGVRAAGTRLLILVYPEDGRLVRKLLPADNKKSRKNLTYRTLFTEFDRIDSKGRRRSVPALLSLDSPARLRGLPSASADREDPRGREDRDQRQEESEEEEQDQEEPELSRAVRSKSLGSVLSDVEQPQEQDEDDRTCVFCGDISDKYASEDGMEYHFWKHCPMLLRCKHCKQVVEIASYTEHLLRECKDHENYRHCDTCHEAIALRDYDEHVYTNNCTPARSGPAGNRCPLCHQNTAPYDAGWQTHLVTECTANPRNRNLSSALVRLHGHHRGSLAQQQHPQPRPPQHEEPPSPPARTEDSGGRTAARSPPERPVARQELAPPTDVPGRFSFSSDAPAYLRQAGRSTSMADLRDLPLALPPRRRSTGDEPPPFLGRTLRERQSPPEPSKSPLGRTLRDRQSPPEPSKSPLGSTPRDRQSPPEDSKGLGRTLRDRQSSPEASKGLNGTLRERRSPPEASKIPRKERNSPPSENRTSRKGNLSDTRHQMSPPERERQARSPSRNRSTPPENQRGSSRSRRDSSRNRNGSSENRLEPSRNRHSSYKDDRKPSNLSKSNRASSENRLETSRNRHSSNIDDRNSSKSNQGSSRQRRPPGDAPRRGDPRSRPDGRSPAAGTPPRRTAEADRVTRDSRGAPADRGRRAPAAPQTRPPAGSGDGGDRDRRDRDARQNASQKRRSGEATRDGPRTSSRDHERAQGRRDDPRDGGKPGRRDDRDVRSKGAERDRDGRTRKTDSMENSRSRLTGREGASPAAGRDRRSQSQKPSARTEPRATRLDDTRRSMSTSRIPQTRRR